MPEYDDNNSGVLFKNDKKETDKHPDWRGFAEINKVEYWMSAWVKENEHGKFLSFSLRGKEDPDNEMWGLAFKNRNKEAGDKKPDYVGSAKDDTIEVAAWNRKSKKGDWFVSLKMTPKEEEKAPTGTTEVQDEIPF